MAVRRESGEEATRLRREAKKVAVRIEQIDLAIGVLGPITPSINRRLELVHYHYENWLEVKDQGTYAAKLSHALGGDGYVNAIKYNAEVLAFLQNMHALCDTLPYVLNLYFHVFDFNSRDIGWKNRTIEPLAKAAREQGEDVLADKLRAFAKNPLFLQLQDIVNCAKHKHLIPIFFRNDRTFFAELDGGWKASETDVHKFMLAVDHELLTLAMEMLELASQRAA